MDTDVTTAAALYAGSVSTVTMTWTLFATLFAAINDPLQGDVNGIIGSLTGFIYPHMREIVTAIGLGTMLFSAINDHFANRIPTDVLLSLLVRFAAVFMIIANAGAFEQWVSGPLLNLPDALSNAILGSVGGTSAKGGAQFDALWNHIYVADSKVAGTVQFWTIEGICLGLTIFITAILSLIFIAFAFTYYLIAYVLLSIVVAMGPIFVATLVSRHSRHFFSGWIAAVVSIIVNLVLVNVLLAVMIRTLQQNIDTVMNASDNADTMGLVGNVAGMAGLMFITALMTKQFERIAVGISGGVYFEAGRVVSTLSNTSMNAVNLGWSRLTSNFTVTPVPVAAAGRGA